MFGLPVYAWAVLPNIGAAVTSKRMILNMVAGLGLILILLCAPVTPAKC
ncbi:MAG TPA: hypothetical protein VGC53_03300 [Vicinamibacteria bacterium]